MITIKAPIRPNERSPQVDNLQDGLLLLLDSSFIRVDSQEPNLDTASLRREQETSTFGEATASAVARFQRQYADQFQLVPSGEVDAATASALMTIVRAAVIARRTSGAAQHRTLSAAVEGAIHFDHGEVAGGIVVRAFRRNFGGSEELLGEDRTDAEGLYAIPYRAVGAVHLEMRALDAQGREVPLSRTKFNAAQHETLYLVAPGGLLQRPSEFHRLMADIRVRMAPGQRIGGAREDESVRDITLLRESTGWDDDLIALAASADRLAERTGVPVDAVYGLLRAGLPDDEDAFAAVSASDVELALQGARRAAVIDLDDDQSAHATAAFERFARERLLRVPAPGALSSLGDFLARSGLTDEEQRRFADLCFSHRGSPEVLWEKAGYAGLSPSRIDSLRLQAKLAALTSGNAFVSQRLQREVATTGRLDHLVERGLYRADDWLTLINDAAAENSIAIDGMIPPSFRRGSGAEPVKSYAAALALQVRLAFPTQVVACMIASDELKVPGVGTAKTAVATALMQAARRGFVIGSTPFEAFFGAAGQEVLPGVKDPERRSILQHLKRVVRLYQTTPSNQALNALLEAGFDSAQELAPFTEQEFVARHGHRFATPQEAALVIRKARQVTSLTHAVVAGARQMRSAPPVYALSAGRDQRLAAESDLIRHYPTLEALLGSTDYCDCEHCRSVLSPAAYLVDLLQFLNPDAAAWRATTERWRATHDQEVYDGPRFAYAKPFDAFAERRPDIPNLLLTCENTQTTLPHIDIVNEVLEYFVAFDHLDAQAAHDTGTASSADLLAEPQNMLPDAYGKLAKNLFPIALPFDLAIETVRRVLNLCEVPFARVLDVFRPIDVLFASGANPDLYDRAGVFVEGIGISTDERNVFSNRPLGIWQELYGYTNPAEALSDMGRLPGLANIPDSASAVYRFGNTGGPDELDETFGILLPDLSAAHNNALLVKGPMTGVPGALPGNNAITLDGISQFVLLPRAAFGNYPILGTSNPNYQFTFETWFNAPHQASGVLLSQTAEDGDPDNGQPPTDGWVPAVHLGTDGKIRTSLFWHNTTERLVSPGSVTYNDRLWHHLAVTFGNGVETLYIDGQQVAQKAVQQTAYERTYNYFLGTGYTKGWTTGNGDWHFFRGQLDEPVFYQQACTAQHIAARFALRAAPPVAGLPNAKVLARRLQVSYVDLAEILQQAFVNPGLAAVRAPLGRLRLGVDQVLEYFRNRPMPEYLAERQAFEDRLKLLDKELGQDAGFAQAALEALDAAGSLKSVIVLRDRGATGNCDFGQTWVEDGNGLLADPPMFLRLNFFVRLLRKLGWTIEELGQALEVFLPAAILTGDGSAIGEAMPTCLVYLSHFDSLVSRLATTGLGRAELLTLWSDIPTAGATSLYAQRFLVSNVLKSDPIFDDPLGRYLQVRHGAEFQPFHWDDNHPENRAQGNVPLKTHLLAVQGALGLTAIEVDQILKASKSSLDKAALSLATLSLLQRHACFTKGLGISVSDLLSLVALSGLDPFKALLPLLTKLEDDFPFTQTLRFVEIVEEIRGSGLTVEDLEYLLLHRFDERGKYRAGLDATQSLVMSIAKDVRAILDANELPADPGSMSEGEIRQMLGLVLPAAVIERFLALLNGTAEFTVQTPASLANQLSATTFAGELAIGQVVFDKQAAQQSITFRGVLFAEQSQALKATFDPTLSAAQQSIFNALLDQAETKSQAEAQAFFDAHLVKQPLGNSASTGFLRPEDFALLFARNPTLAPSAGQEAVRARRAALATAFVPFLQERLIRQYIVQTMTTYAAADSTLVESMVTDERLLSSFGPLLASLASLGVRGVSARFFASVDASGDPLSVRDVLPSVDTFLMDSRDAHGAVVSAANSAEFDGLLEVPTSGVYRFFAELKNPGATAELRFPHLPKEVLWAGVATDHGVTIGSEPDAFIELRAGVAYRYTLRLTHLAGGHGRLLVQGETLAKGGLEQLTLYPSTFVDRARRAVMLLAKALQIAKSLGLSEREIRYVATHSAAFGNANLSLLPTGPGEGSLDNAQQLFAPLCRLVAYARLKSSIAGGGDGLIDVFEANGTGDSKKLLTALAQLTRRDEDTVEAAIKPLFRAGAPLTIFDGEEPVQRLWQVLEVASRLGATVPAVTAWTAIVTARASANVQQRSAIAAEVRNAVKGRFDAQQWQRVAKPIFDNLRQRQRDALVSYVMHRNGFERVEELYEYFLIDPGMEPVVETTRVLAAISSVQTFVQRCLLGLEPKVPPSVINAAQWEWMKRYRVWEANRKFFLYPENWLEPEFRDDKSHLFREFEGELLSGEISDDRAAAAFSTYLRGLDAIARLQVMSTCFDEESSGQRTMHVIARTFGAPHKYFYRRYAEGMWTPWEPVTTEIEGDHVVMALWRKRLHVFWLTFLVKAQDPDGTPVTLSLAGQQVSIPTVQKREIELHLSWSEYFEGQWTTPEASQSVNPVRVDIKDIKGPFTPTDVLMHVTRSYAVGEEDAVVINLMGPIVNSQPVINSQYVLTGKNVRPVFRPGTYYLAFQYMHPTLQGALHAAAGTRLHGKGPLVTEFAESMTASVVGTIPATTRLSVLQGADLDYLLVPSPNPSSLTLTELSAFQSWSGHPFDLWDAEPKTMDLPFFLEDGRHTFFVEPSLTYANWPLAPIHPGLQERPNIRAATDRMLLAQFPRQRLSFVADALALHSLRRDDGRVTVTAHSGPAELQH